MEISLFIFKEAARADAEAVFDTREYDGQPLEQEEIREEMRRCLTAFKDVPDQHRVFLLLNPLQDMSIPRLYQRLVLEAEQAGLEALHIGVPSERVKEHILYRIPPAQEQRSSFSLAGKRLILRTGDITEVPAEAIVNASNVGLKLGGGVSGAIAEKASPSLQAELLALAGQQALQPGDVVMTRGHGLPNCRAILQAATAEGSKATVVKAVRQCLQLVRDSRFGSLAFPALGAGTGGLAIRQCARAMLQELRRFADESAPTSPPETILIVVYALGDYEVFCEEAETSLKRA